MSRLRSVSGTTNLRDLGGYLGYEGKHVRWNLLFRSDLPTGPVGPEAIEEFKKLSIKRTIDFRDGEECEKFSYPWGGLVERIPLPVSSGNLMKILLENNDHSPTERAHEFLRQAYQLFVTQYASAFADFLRNVHLHAMEQKAIRESYQLSHHQITEEGKTALTTPEEKALLYHCSAGKDRTGVATILLLTCLGVPQEVFLKDFLLTNEYYKLPTKYFSMLPQECCEVLEKVNLDYLQPLLQQFTDQYGGVEGYIIDVLGFSPKMIQELREYYLE